MKSFSHIAIFIGVVKLVYVSASSRCGDNEVYDTCIAPCPPRRCDVDESLIRCSAPPKPGDPACVAGCRCADNFYRNDKEVCVPKNQCPQKCGINEIPTSCIEAICERRNCSDLGQPITCVRLDTRFCTAGCLCKEGYLRNVNGTCVPIQQCPSTKACEPNEIPTPCFEAICERRDCSDLEKPFSSVRSDPSFCTAGCLCKEGYLRNAKGFCVPINQCSNTNVCGQNEIPTSCIEAICGRKNCSDLGKPISCVRSDPRFCTDGCLCNEGYLRNSKGICVPIDQCPNTNVCGKNEIPTSCIEAICEQRNCSDLGKSISCVRLDPRFCTDGCLCKEGYLRNSKGICVPINQCPNTNVCGINEIPTTCIEAICERRNCSEIGKPFACVRLDTRFCTDGCLCKEGYLRNDANGACVPIGQCPNSQCGADEVFDECPPLCPGESCGVDPSVILCLPNPQPGDPDCNPGCRCRDNYFRNDYGFCVTRDQCPSVCGENEVYDSCPPIYPPLRCNVDEMLTACGMNPEPGSPLCKPGCRCADNYYLNASGDCITKEECLSGVNSTQCNSRSPSYSECINGGCTKWRCTDNGYVCLEKGPCEVGCACQSSYTRSPAGMCMPAAPCPPSKIVPSSAEEGMPQKPKPYYKPYSKSDLDDTLS